MAELNKPKNVRQEPPQSDTANSEQTDAAEQERVLKALEEARQAVKQLIKDETAGETISTETFNFRLN